jgi:putative ABC transport system permease protein
MCSLLKNYLTVAFRHALRDRTFSLINIVGLATGLACGTVILLYLQYEFSYNRHHSKADRIHKLVQFHRQESGGTIYNYGTTGVVGPTLVEEFPEVEDATRFMQRRIHVNSPGEEGHVTNVAVADDRFFEVFDFPVLEGDVENGLATPGSAFITQALAERLFGDTLAVGQIVEVKSKLFDETYEITGILQNVPSNSMRELSPGLVTTTRPSGKDPERIRNIWEDWGGWAIAHTHILLRPGASPEAVREKLPDFAERHLGADWAKWVGYAMIPLTDIHFHGRQRLGLPNQEGDLETCTTLGWIGVFVVIVACINFANLATARAVRRMREVGMRKVAGARRGQLIGQFLGESLALALLSFFLAVGIVALALPSINGAMATHLSLTLSVFPILLIMCLTAGLLAGSYPAFFISSFPTASVLRAGRSGQTSHGTVRKALVAIQFAVSVGLMVCTLIIVRQTEHMRTQNPGYHHEALIVNEQLFNRNAHAMKARFQQIPGVMGASLTSASISTRTSYGADVIPLRSDAVNEEVTVAYLQTDEDFPDVYGIPLKEGRPFLPTEILTAQDPAFEDSHHTILNETAAKRLQVHAGDLVTYWGGSLEVVGIVQDFHFLPLREAIGPYMLFPAIYEQQVFLTLRVTGSNITDTLERAREAWRTFEPNRPFDFQFMDETRATQYESEMQLSRLFAASASLGVGIAALGLLGLIAYSVETRAREIAVRKVLGATAASVAGLLSRELLILVAFSSVLAYPLAYYAMDQWLSHFAYRIAIHPAYFFAATAGALIITGTMIGWQTIRAARANPTEALANQ